MLLRGVEGQEVVSTGVENHDSVVGCGHCLDACFTCSQNQYVGNYTTTPAVLSNATTSPTSMTTNVTDVLLSNATKVADVVLSNASSAAAENVLNNVTTNATDSLVENYATNVTGVAVEQNVTGVVRMQKAIATVFCCNESLEELNPLLFFCGLLIQIVLCATCCCVLLPWLCKKVVFGSGGRGGGRGAVRGHERLEEKDGLLDADDNGYVVGTTYEESYEYYTTNTNTYNY
ncbi:unnamed protein product [Amoebophrya sp. A120]|nr:unnamed protein product [Amoebophrya sp. A120]|eukprot:GSA120T00024964001.1